MLVKNFFVYIFIFFCTIPWVSFQTNGWDSQPWPFIFSLIVLLMMYKEKFKFFDLVWLLIPFFCFSIVFLNLEVINSDVVRSVLNYFFFFVVLFSLIIIKDSGVCYIDIIYKVNIIYLFVSIFQFLFDPYIFDFIVSVRTTEQRGVTSLTPEPTYFGMYLLLTSMMYLFYYNYNLPVKINRLLKINVFFIVFISLSSMAIMYLIIGFLLVFFARTDIKRIINFMLFSFFIILLFKLILNESRVFDIFSLVSNVGILDVVHHDASINDRVSNIVIPLYASFKNGFLPYGFGVFSEHYNFFVEHFDGFFWYGSGFKIQSFINNFVFELGFFSFIIFFIIFFRFFYRRRWGMVEFVFLILILFSAFPVASSLIPLLLVTTLDNNHAKS